MSSKKYTPLSDIVPAIPVERCSQVLANKLQCWKAGEVLVEENGGSDAQGATPSKSDSSSKQGGGQGQTSAASTSPGQQQPPGSPGNQGASAQSQQPQSQQQAQGEKKGVGPEGGSAYQPQLAEQFQGANLPGGSNAPAPPTGKKYQLCSMHAVINQRADQAAAKAGPPKEGEKTPLEKMLGVETKYRTSTMPQAKEEERRHKLELEKEYDKITAPLSEEEGSQGSSQGGQKGTSQSSSSQKGSSTQKETSPEQSSQTKG